MEKFIHVNISCFIAIVTVIKDNIIFWVIRNYHLRAMIIDFACASSVSTSLSERGLYFKITHPGVLTSGILWSWGVLGGDDRGTCTGVRDCVSSVVPCAPRVCMCVTVADACLRANGASYNIRGVRASGGTSVGMSPGRGRAFYIHREDIIFTGSLKKRANARANK